MSFLQDVKPVVSECTETYKNVLNYVKYCRDNPNQVIVEETIILCDISIEKLNFIREKIATSGPRKQSCFYTINLIKSLKDDLASIIVKEGGNLDRQNVKWLESDAAFESSIRMGIIKNLNHLDPKKFSQMQKLFSCEK